MVAGATGAGGPSMAAAGAGCAAGAPCAAAAARGVAARGRTNNTSAAASPLAKIAVSPPERAFSELGLPSIMPIGVDRSMSTGQS